MEHRLGEETIVCGSMATNMKVLGKRSVEWDLNDWKWDGDFFHATPLNPVTYDSRSSQCLPLVPELQLAVNADLSTGKLPFSKETIPVNENGTRESEKKRRIVVVHEDDELNDEYGSLNLKLGEQVYPIVDTEVDKGIKSEKNNKNAGTSHPVCQVEGCMTDLTNVRAYNRRHKVCEVHSKANEALVGNLMQRFCQQCSRFHALEEFDGDKRSCRKRLAGHNKRRRKTHPETSPNVSVTDGLNASQILNLLLRVLSSTQSNGPAQANDQDLVSQILQHFAVLSDGSNTSRLLQGSQGSLNVGTSNVIPDKDNSMNQEPSQNIPNAQIGSLMGRDQREIPHTTSMLLPAKGSVQRASVEKHILGGIDLNAVYNDEPQDCIDDLANGSGFGNGLYWAEQTLPSPPPTSGNSATISGQSSSGSGEAQCRTDRIVFKLFDKDPNDLPNVLRTQILDWLAHSPSDIEGYIRPGCIVLTLYLRLNTSIWEQFCYDISSSLSRLLDLSNEPFWKRGWIYTRIQQRAAFICDGKVILDTPLPFKIRRNRILSISPIAIPAGETVQLVIRGSSLFGPTSRLLCAIEGKYLIQDNCSCLVEGTNDITDEEIQSFSFSCSIPNVIGRGFIEVEDYDFTGCFFPFIVAEPEVCYEICMLEKEMEVGSTEDSNHQTDAKNKALNFIHEMGWLLHRNGVRFKGNEQGSPFNVFPFERLKCLVEFSMDHDWCAVMRKLLDLLFSGIVDIGSYESVEGRLADITLLHTAVRRNSRPMVEFLLSYVPSKIDNTLVAEQKQADCGPPTSMLFRPDVAGVGGLTPLHIAASSAGAEKVLDALLEDPGKVGIEAWKNARDSMGFTPCDYASLRGHYRYLHLVQKKINHKSYIKHVVLDIPSLSHIDTNKTQTNKLKYIEFDSFFTEKLPVPQSCKLCEQTPGLRFGAGPLRYRPLMMSLVAIAVVCVCTALLFKSAPQVCDIFGPFRWESLKFGAV